MPVPVLIGQSAPIRKARATIERLAALACAVSLVGETGSGKEEAARLLHSLSPRRAKPFHVLPMQHMHGDLAESRIHGHVKGAFTGALGAAGPFEAADGGSVLVDELDRASKEGQALLLRVLDGRGFSRVGSTATINPDFRLLVAAARHPVSLAEDGLLEEHLFYRIGVNCVVIPPLRDRIDDIELLLAHAIHRSDRRSRWEPPAIERLKAYHWPGNVRQFIGVVQGAMDLSDESVSLAVVDDILSNQPRFIRKQDPKKQSKAARQERLVESRERLGSYRAVAAIEDVSERTIRRDLKELEWRRRAGG